MVTYMTDESTIYQTLKLYKPYEDIVNWYERNCTDNEQIVIDIIGETNDYLSEGNKLNYISQRLQVTQICRKNEVECRKDFAKFMKLHFIYEFTTSYIDNEEYYISVYILNHVLKEWS